MAAELPTTEQIFTETSRLVPLEKCANDLEENIFCISYHFTAF